MVESGFGLYACTNEMLVVKDLVSITNVSDINNPWDFKLCRMLSACLRYLLYNCRIGVVKGWVSFTSVLDIKNPWKFRLHSMLSACMRYLVYNCRLGVVKGWVSFTSVLDIKNPWNVAKYYIPWLEFYNPWLGWENPLIYLLYLIQI